MKKSFYSLLFLICLTFVFMACEKDLGENETKISQHNEDESHKNGKNCMDCHYSGGSGEGWFNVAGSVYDETKQNYYPNATVKLFTGPNGTGTLVKTVEVDGKGNFYTTEYVDFQKELYTSVINSKGEIKHMNSAISIGECNSCHGNSIDNIWVE